STSADAQLVSFSRLARASAELVLLLCTTPSKSMGVMSALGSALLQLKKRCSAVHFLMSIGLFASVGKSRGCIHPMSAAWLPSRHHVTSVAVMRKVVTTSASLCSR